MCRAFTAAYGLETVSLRLFNVFGPRQDPSSQYAAVVPSFIGRMLRSEPPVVFGDGLQSRDFTYVGNVVQAFTLAAEAGPGPVGEALNVACGGRTTLLGLIEAINGVLGARIEPEFTDARPGDVRHSHASIERARSLIDYEPLIELNRGLEDTIAWYRSVGVGTPAAVGEER
jgi:UDP-glucose 4-epimerase